MVEGILPALSPNKLGDRSLEDLKHYQTLITAEIDLGGMS